MTERSRGKLVQDVPPAETLEQNLADQPPIAATFVYEVCSWRAGPANSGQPCTEVHLLLPVVDGVRVALRLKSARALDELVAVLLEYRKGVFG
jgi:hypothetical protein